LREIAKLYDDVTMLKIAHGKTGDTIDKSVVDEV